MWQKAVEAAPESNAAREAEKSLKLADSGNASHSNARPDRLTDIPDDVSPIMVIASAFPDTRKLESLLAAFRDAGSKTARRFLGRRAKRIYLINLHEILFFKVDNNLVFIVTESGEYWINYTLAEIEDAVDSALFVRTHRQYIVSLDKIKEIAPLAGGNYLLRMANGSQVEVSRRQSRRLLELLGR
jgi:DNA-binding LytR/AlgR family response regulator